MDEIVRVEQDADIVTLILNRPDKLNALSKALWQGVGDTMRQLATDESLRCIVLRGAGDRAFSPGADIKEFESERANFVQAKAYGTVMHQTMPPFVIVRFLLLP